MKSIFVTFLVLYFVFWNSTVIGFSNQEDLSIRNYSFIGCLKLAANKSLHREFLQENSLSPYQSYSSPNLTVELCFRLCRRWFILMFQNQTHCFCFHTLLKPLQLTKYLGEILPIQQCQSNDGQIFSLINEFDILPTLANAFDWSFDGCYYLQGIEQVRASFWLSQLNYPQALENCRKSCQSKRDSSSYSFFLSRRKSCYCLPIRFSSSVRLLAVRKPLIHCSFIPYLCQESSETCQNRSSTVHLDTVVKIDVQRQCFMNNGLTFRYDSHLQACLQTISLTSTTNFTDLVNQYACTPLSIRTEIQWNSFLQSNFLLSSSNHIWIDQNSFDTMKQVVSLNLSSLSILPTDLCFTTQKTISNQTYSFEFHSCTNIPSTAVLLCAQKPIDHSMQDEEEFTKRPNENKFLNNKALTCPSGFILFNQICYYFHTTFVYNRLSAEDACANETINSTLAQFEFHPWANINSTRFLSRTRDDSLLEFFYYELEQKLLTQTIHHYTRKHWLRLLLGSQKASNACVLRYFTSSTGSFSTIHQCTNGGHPVCQCKPIGDQSELNESIEKTDEKHNTTFLTSTNESLMNAGINRTLGSAFSTAAMPTFDNDTADSTTDNKVLVWNNSNRSNHFMDKAANETDLNQQKGTSFKYQPLIILLTGPVLAMLILSVGIILLLAYLRNDHNSNSNQHTSTGLLPRRTKRSSTLLTLSEITNTPKVHYTRSKPTTLKLPPESETLITSDRTTSYSNEDRIEIISTTVAIATSMTDHTDKERLLSPTSS